MQHVTISNFSVSSELLIDSVVFDAPKCLIHTNFIRLNEDLGRRHLRSLYVARKQTIPEIRLHRLPSGAELSTQGNDDFIVCEGDQVLAEQVRAGWTEADLATALAQASGLRDISEEVILLARAGVQTWGHWLVELLPKAICVEQAYPKRFRYIVPHSIVTNPRLRPLRQSLEAYGLGPERLLLVRGGRKYRFTNLFAVSPIRFRQHALHPKVAALIRGIAPGTEQLSGMPKSIALLRRETSTRNLANIGEICTYLEARGWSIIDVAHLDFVDQVRLFANCEKVISVLGSGLAGLIYAPQRVKVATLAPSHWSDLFFFSLMQEREAQLADIRGISVGVSLADVRRAPFVLDIADLEAGLRALDLSVEPLSAGRNPATGSNWKPQSLHELVDAALRLSEAGRLAEAEEPLRQAARRAPGDLTVLTQLADLLMRQDKIAEALRLAEQGLAIYPSAVLLRLMQKHLTRLGRYAEAVDFARREVASDPEESEAFSLLGHALRRVDQFNEAADCFHRALSLRGKDLGLYLARSNALARAGRLEEAVAATQAAIAACPRQPPLYLQLGQMLASQGKLEAAADALNEVVALEPGNAGALRALAGLDAAAPPKRRVPASVEVVASVEPAHTFGVRDALSGSPMGHLQFLALMKRLLQPRTYLEVGIGQGESLFSDPVPEFVIGIDPNPRFGAAFADQIGACRGLLIIRSTSDDAFARLLTDKVLGERKLDLAFVDGLHHSDVVLRDIANCARFSRKDALIFVHDVFPGNESQASRQAIPGAWMGDVYKIVPIIWRYFSWVPNLLIKDIPPSGMFILRASDDLYKAIFSQYDRLVAAMGNYEFAPTIEEMNAKAVSHTSSAFAAFIEQSMDPQTSPTSVGPSPPSAVPAGAPGARR